MEKQSPQPDGHVPVLFQESLDGLAIQPDGIYIDGTLGGAGHAYGIAQQLSADGTIIGCDVDADAIARAHEKLSTLPCKKHFIHNNFASLPDVLNQMNITAVDGVLLDLGWSSFQISDATRGLSFTHDGPLDMNLSKGLSGDRLTAYEIINHWEEKTLADIFYAYGDETKARVIARCIVQERSTKPIETTHELANCVIKALYPRRYGQEKPIYFKSHPATKVFQALRIAVNDEFAVLESFIHNGITLLSSGGRFAIITFHSGEDRIVKQIFKSYAVEEKVRLITKKPITPQITEVQKNVRARSAKLRIVEKI